MPAVTADPLSLPRLTTTIGVPSRPLRRLTTAPAGFEGEGFPVRRAFAGVPLAELDPFIHMDQMGAIDYAPGEPRGTAWHPHRGFETVTYLLDGTFLHQDSHGGGGVIQDGGTQWMTAGGGILHIETPPEALVVSGGLFHGVQLWVNLPAADKMISPRYQNLDAPNVVMVTTPDAGAVIRLIAGELDGHRGPGSTHTPISVMHATVSPDAVLTVPWPATFNALAYVLSGSGTVGDEQASFGTGQLAVFGDGDSMTFRASKHEPLDVLLLGGRPLREPVVTHGPFVMNTRDEIIAAIDDFQAGRLGVVPPGALQPFHVR